MKSRRKKAYILYISNFRSHRLHRELVNGVTEFGWMINAVPWEDSADGTYTGGLPVDGVISHLPARHTRVLCGHIGDIPHVTLNAMTADELKIPGVVSDHTAAGRMVAQHFVELGFTNFAAFAHLQHYATFDARIAGFADFTKQAGLPPPERITLPETAKDSEADKLAFYSEALKTLPIPFAIMAANDRVAVRLMYACWQANLSIPAQVAICGFDNDPAACDLAPIPLSSVDTNPEVQGREAIRLLASLMQGIAPPAKPLVIAPKRLEVRRSSGIRAHTGLSVAKALAYIHEHVWEDDLGIPEIAEQAGVSQTTLFAAFKNELQKTPLQYITGLRITEAIRLLRETDMKVKQIRCRCGFASDYQMFQAFKRATGRSPGGFRRNT